MLDTDQLIFYGDTRKNIFEELIVNDVRLPRQDVAVQFGIVFFELESIFFDSSLLSKAFLAMLSVVND